MALRQVRRPHRGRTRPAAAKVAEPRHGTNTAMRAVGGRVARPTFDRSPPPRVDLLGERKIRRDHRDVAQRQRLERRHKDRAARDLCGVLRGADHRRPDMLRPARRSGTPKPATRARISCAKAAPRSPKCLGLAPVDEFGNAAGERERTDLVHASAADRAAAANGPRRTGEPPRMASNRQSAIAPASLCVLLSRELSPGSRASPSSAPKRCPAGSMRRRVPSASTQMSRAPTSSAVTADDPAIGTDRDL